MFGFKKKKDQETETKVLEFKVETMKDALQVSKEDTKDKVHLGKHKLFSFFKKEKRKKEKKEKLLIVKKPLGRSAGPFFVGKTSSTAKSELPSQPKQQPATEPESKIKPTILLHKEKIKRC